MKKLFFALLALALLFLIWHTLVRIVRYFYKFPMPEFLTDVIDNPLRRWIQSPEETAIRHGILPGMTVLEIGPGNGTYTLAAARLLGSEGKMTAIDIEPKIIQRLGRRLQDENIDNVEARVADVHDLPYEDGTFDVITMIAVIGELPDKPKALAEFHRLLKPSGTLVFSELLMDPDYPRAETLTRLGARAGFHVKQKLGNFFYYTLILEKDTPSRRQDD